jgi:hypothetical protein
MADALWKLASAERATSGNPACDQRRAVRGNAGNRHASAQWRGRRDQIPQDLATADLLFVAR